MDWQYSSRTLGRMLSCLLLPCCSLVCSAARREKKTDLISPDNPLNGIPISDNNYYVSFRVQGVQNSKPVSFFTLRSFSPWATKFSITILGSTTAVISLEVLLSDESASQHS